MGQRRRAREFAVQMLFQIDLTGDLARDVVEQFWSEREDIDDLRTFSETLVLGVQRTRPELDAMILGSARNWRIERMAVVDRNVLRMAVFELMQQPSTPPPVVIDEAIEIARKFGTGDSASFVNGVLDSIRTRLEQPPEAGSGKTENGR